MVKKYRSLKAELATLVSELETHPAKGIPLGNDIYKIRLAIASKGKYKSFVNASVCNQKGNCIRGALHFRRI